MSTKIIYKYRQASVPDIYSNVKVIEGTDEIIYDKKYVTAIVNNNRIAKFLKTSIKFK